MPKRLLFLSQCLPYPTDEGAKIRTYHILKAFSHEYAVRALCFYRRTGHQNVAAVDASLVHLRTLADVDAFPIPEEYSRTRLLLNHARSVLGGEPYTHYSYASDPFARALSVAVREFRPELIYIESLDLVRYLPALPAGVPVVCGHQNVESELLQRRAENSSTLQRAYFRLQSRLMARVEARSLPAFQLNIAVSVRDAEGLRVLAPDASVLVIPNGVDTTKVTPLSDSDSGIVFVGGSTWFPNRDALMFFCREILPLVRAKLGPTTITWVGNSTEKDRLAMKRDFDVDLTGHVPDVAPYVEAAACFVVPLRIGGGTRLKILYAWAMERAIVSTSVGCEGLDAVDGRNMHIRDDPEEFADAIVQVVRDRAHRCAMAARGRATAVNSYDWTVVCAPLLTECRHLC